MFLTSKNFYFEVISSNGFQGLLGASQIQNLELTTLQNEGTRNEIFELKSGEDRWILKQAIVYSGNVYFGFNREVSYYKHIDAKSLKYLSSPHKYFLMPRGYPLGYSWLCDLLFAKDENAFENGTNYLLSALEKCITAFYISTDNFKGVAGIAEYEVILNAFKNYYTFDDIELLFELRGAESDQKNAVKHFLNHPDVTDFLLNKCTAVVFKRDIIHGDLFVRNILMKEKGYPAVPELYLIDFENLAVGDRVYDLVTLTSSIVAELCLKFGSNSKSEERRGQLRFFMKEAVKKISEITGEEEATILEKYYYLFILHRLQKLVFKKVKNFRKHLDLILKLVRYKATDWYLDDVALDLYIQND
ncbi:MAG: phosphotransferase [Leadbetterella sp.]|nr:phosphotransferase [Leadbetterella sp.]